MRIIDNRTLPDSFFECGHKDGDALSEVKKIINDVKAKGEPAVIRYTRKFDNVTLSGIRVGQREISRAHENADPAFLKAVAAAAQNIRKFALRQRAQIAGFRKRIAPGVIGEQRAIPMQRVGVYVPAGRYPLVSTLLMCAIPAQAAGVGQIVVCSPPGGEQGTVSSGILAAAKILGVREIYRIGGAQAIAAMAYGIRSLKRVDKIVGPGNRYVSLAKKELFGVVGIDFIAGPSEIMIIADQYAEPAIVAADLLAQAEHDVDAVPLLVTNSYRLARAVKKEIQNQLAALGTRSTAERSLSRNGRMILVKNMRAAVELANKKAPEHLELQIKDASAWVGRLRNYGSLFVGKYAAEVLGDYSSGLNHTLPTGLTARYTGGLSVRDFVKFQTILRVTKKGIASIGSVAEKFAQIEGLEGHAQAVRIRFPGR